MDPARILLSLVAFFFCTAAAYGAETRKLKICADPNNLPFSNAREEGFENKIARLIARDLGAAVEYTWWAQRRGFVRNTLKAGKCDLVMGAPTGFELVLATKPYYRSTYVFVYPKSAGLNISSLDDPRLRMLKVGVQLIGDDFANTPPAHALTRRNIIQNIIGYTVYGDYREPNPPARIVEGVAKGEADVALVWGPLAGYFAKRQRVPLAIVPVSPRIDPPDLAMEYDIALGVRRGEHAFKAELEAILDRRRADIRKVLNEYGVPLVEPAGPKS